MSVNTIDLKDYRVTITQDSNEIKVKINPVVNGVERLPLAYLLGTNYLILKTPRK